MIRGMRVSWRAGFRIQGSVEAVCTHRGHRAKKSTWHTAGAGDGHLVHSKAKKKPPRLTTRRLYCLLSKRESVFGQHDIDVLNLEPQLVLGLFLRQHSEQLLKVSIVGRL